MSVVVCLIPARTGTGWWHRYFTRADEIRFLKGRLRFGNAKSGASFPSAIVVFRPGTCQKKEVSFVAVRNVQKSLFVCD